MTKIHTSLPSLFFGILGFALLDILMIDFQQMPYHLNFNFLNGQCEQWNQATSICKQSIPSLQKEWRSWQWQKNWNIGLSISHFVSHLFLAQCNGPHPCYSTTIVNGDRNANIKWEMRLPRYLAATLLHVYFLMPVIWSIFSMMINDRLVIFIFHLFLWIIKLRSLRPPPIFRHFVKKTEWFLRTFQNFWHSDSWKYFMWMPSNRNFSNLLNVNEKDVSAHVQIWYQI